MSNNARLAIAVALLLMINVGVWLGRSSPLDGATPAEAAAPASDTEPPADPYQRSLEIFTFRKAAPAGVERGREIYYYKCWFCHNEWAEGAPRLEGVFQKARLLSGRPATEENIRDQILNGSAGMAAYRYALSPADLDDLIAFLKEACCWNSDAPPLNPRYRAGAAR